MAGGPGPPGHDRSPGRDAPTAARLPDLRDRSLGSIRPSEVQAWVRGLERDLAPSTIGVVYSFVAGIFRTAVRDRIIVASPCVDIRLPKLEPKRVEPLATEKVEALIEAMPSRYRALVVLAAGTGLRRTLRVDRQLVLLPGGEPYIAPPKTPASHPDGAASPDRRRRAGGPPGDYYASLLIRHGESVKVVQHRLGHKSAVETLDTYSHLWPDSEDRTREAVDQVLGPAAAGGNAEAAR
jgi:site-specific recombinase XerD